MERHLVWEGCANVRDLGGLPTRDGMATVSGAVVRSDHPDRLSELGWEALRAYGIRTIVTLTTDGLPLSGQALRTAPSDVETVTVAVEDARDREFSERWAKTGLWGTPLYWADALRRWPARYADAVSVVANAGPGAVLVHCGRGHDRTGIVTALLLTLVNVPFEAIAVDYGLSEASLVPEERAELLRILGQQGTSSRAAILRFSADIDVSVCLRAGGLTERDVSALRARLVRGAPQQAKRRYVRQPVLPPPRYQAAFM